MLALAGPAAADPLRWADEPMAIDNLRPGDGRAITAASCPQPVFCVAVDARGDAFFSRGPTGGELDWSFTTVTRDQGLSDVDCPTTKLCVAVGADGTIATSTDPAGGHWTVTHAGNTLLEQVECPTTALCVASTFSGDVYTSATPAAGGWTASQTDGAWTALSCPAVNLCVAGGFGGVVISSDPADGDSWTDAPVDFDGYVVGVSCGSPSLCMAADSAGRIATSTNPANGPWTLSTLGAGPGHHVVCASSTLCVASEYPGVTTSVTRNPAAASPTWTPANTGLIVPLDCAGNDFCIATDSSRRGEVLTSSQPVGAYWQESRFDRIGVRVLRDVACPSPTRCVAVDSAGRVLASSDPGAAWHEETDLGDEDVTAIACPTSAFCAAGGSGALFTYDGTWKRSTSPPLGFRLDISCASASLCAAVDDMGSIVRWNGAAWSRTRAGDGFALRGVACPTSTLCVAVGDRAALVSTDGATTWSARQITSEKLPLTAVACPSADLCVAGDSHGRALVTLDPAADRPWSAPGTFGLVNSIACPSVSLCVAVDFSGAARATNDPAGGVWVAGAQGQASATGVACAADAVCVKVDSDGFAWAAGPTGVPFNTSAPVITGPATAGSTLRCSPGGWSPAPTSLRYQWESDGQVIASGDTYTPPAAGTVTCRVSAGTAAGEAVARGTIGVVPAPPPQETPRIVTPGPTRFSGRIAARAPRLNALIRSGLPVTVTCSASCTVTLRLGLSSSDTRRLHLKRGAAIGSAKAKLARAGSVTVKVRLTAAARRALARVERLKLTLGATEASKRAIAGSGTLTLRR